MLFAELWDALIRSRRIASGIRRLNHLDDRLLADIGIDRAEIPRFVRGEVIPAAREMRRQTRTVVRNAYLRPDAEDCEGDAYRVAI